MKYVKPVFYDEFQCVASECPSTCCASWEIGIDDKTLEKYKEEKGPFGNRLKNSVDWEQKSFQQYEGSCVFLNEDKMCDIHAEKGEDMLCRTCKQYPRHMEVYEGRRELSLALSCPEVAGILLGREEKTEFSSYQKNKPMKPDEEFNHSLFSVLKKARKTSYYILQNRTQDIEICMCLVLALAHDLQKRLDVEDWKGAMLIIRRYEDPKVQQCLGQKILGFDSSHSLEHMRNIVKALGKLECTNRDWAFRYEALDEFLHFLNEKDYQKLRKEFRDVRAQSSWKNYMEQLMVYFVYTYFCGAVYDGNAYGKMKFSAVSTLFIAELNMCQWANQGKELEFHQLVQNAYCYAREIEHFDENLELLEHMLDRRECFHLETLIETIKL